MAVRRRGDRWEISFYHESAGRRKRYRRLAVAQTRRGAEAEERRARESIGAHGVETPAPAVPTVSSFAKEFVEVYAVTHNKPSEVRAKLKHLNCHIIPWFGREQLDAISRRDLDAFKADLGARGLAPKTINNTLTTWNRMGAVAAEWGIAEMARAKLLRIPKGEIEFLDFDEAARLVGAVDGRDRLIAVLLLNTGLRSGELQALRWDAVDLDRATLDVRATMYRGKEQAPKSGRGRTVPLNRTVLAEIRAARHMRGPYVVCRDNGEPYTGIQVYRTIGRACRLAGLRRVSAHDMRHTFASHLAMRGVSLQAIRDLLGHSTITMTLRYAHLLPSTTADAVAVLDATNGNEVGTAPHGDFLKHAESLI